MDCGSGKAPASTHKGQASTDTVALVEGASGPDGMGMARCIGHAMSDCPCAKAKVRDTAGAMKTITMASSVSHAASERW